MSPPSLLEAALHLALVIERPVFPCEPRGKAPIVRRGLRAATTNESIIRAWWAKTPDANVALRTGWGLLVVDVDGDIGRASLTALEHDHGRLPPSVEAYTARGKHLFFGYDETAKVRSTAGAIGPGLDTRADGGYVLVQPSIHPTGARYRWRRGHEPGEHGLADAPEWLLERLRARGPLLRAVPGTKGQKRHESMRPGQRDRSSSGVDWRMAMTLMRAGATDDQVARELRRRSAKYMAKGAHGESYIETTVRHARDACEMGDAVRATVRQARLEFLPERFGHPERTRILLTMQTGDGEVIEASIVVPSKGYSSSAAVFAAAFPDLDAAQLAQRSWAASVRYFESIKWRGRQLEVAVRGGEVRWVRTVSASETSKTQRGGAR